ncbi:MAG: type VI secretion system contractile sheath large subunit [Alphaproteobacteria bacterium]|nr:type VI secretion system contractile sheath large subunit [Alphaproteobacteria bacterium]
MSAELFFEDISDFEPLSVVKQIPELDKLYNARIRLKDLMTKLDGNDALDDMLRAVITDADKRTAFKAELGIDGDASADTPLLNAMMSDGRLARDETQQAYAKELVTEFLKELIEQGDSAATDTVAFISQRMQHLDDMMTGQLNEFMHDPDFQQLEGSWRGLHYLVMNTETSTHLKLRFLNISKHEILEDLEKAIEFDQSMLFKKIYEEEYGTFGGHPYSCLIGDYEFTRHPMDLELLQKISQVAAAAHAPFITAAHAKLFDLDTFEHLGVPRDLSKIFESLELIKWTSFRDMEDSRYVTLTLPHTLIRMPYGANTMPAEGINFEEDVAGADSSKFCWTNTAYILAERITNAFAHYGWTAAIRGVEGGGIVEGLPAYTFKTTDGDIALKCPTQVAITDRREKELSDLGFVALCHCKGTDYAAFFGGQTAQKAKVYNTDDANANATLSSRLPYILAASRFAHYIKVIMRDKIGSFMTKDNVAKYLNTWIASYVLLNDDASQNVKARYPLREARIDVFDIPGKPGSYTSVVYLRPHFQLEELSVSIRLVATLPPPAK